MAHLALTNISNTLALYSRAQYQMATILSSIVGGSKLHAYVEPECNTKTVKSCARKCILGRKDTKDGPLE